MIRLKALDELAHRLSELLPPGMEDARVDVEKNFRAALHSGAQQHARRAGGGARAPLRGRGGGAVSGRYV